MIRDVQLELVLFFVRSPHTVYNNVQEYQYYIISLESLCSSSKSDDRLEETLCSARKLHVQLENLMFS